MMGTSWAHTCTGHETNKELALRVLNVKKRNQSVTCVQIDNDISDKENYRESCNAMKCNSLRNRMHLRIEPKSSKNENLKESFTKYKHILVLLLNKNGIINLSSSEDKKKRGKLFSSTFKLLFVPNS